MGALDPLLTGSQEGLAAVCIHCLGIYVTELYEDKFVECL